MRRSLILSLIVAMVAAAAVGCDGDDDGGDNGQPTAPVTTETAATATGTPGPTATPDPVPLGLRSLVNAARTGNVAAIEAAVRYQPVPCTTNQQGVGGPPLCREGEAEGTPVNVVFATTCEGYYARPGELALDQIEFGAAGGGDALYGVYAIDPASQLARIEAWDGATHAIVLNRTQGDATLPYVFITDGTAVIGTATGCGETPEEWVDFQGLGEPLLAP
jgi:hypothetical protein